MKHLYYTAFFKILLEKIFSQDKLSGVIYLKEADMTAKELMDTIFHWCDDNGIKDYSSTCDTIKSGTPDRKIRKVAVTMTATADLIREVQAWGADLLIVHEPTFYDHFEQKLENDPVTRAKEELLAKTDMVVWRYHDHPHNKKKDMIGEGTVRMLGFEGKWINRAWAINRFLLNEPLSPREIENRFRKNGCEHVRICGNIDTPCRMISLCLGTPAGVFEELRDPEVEIVLSGESCEWMLGEYARDAAELGFNKSLMIIGHNPSEKGGMILLAELIKKEFPELETKYFECGEVYKTI